MPLAHHKHKIRKCFHRQLRHLWATNQFLREHKEHPKGSINHRSPGESGAYLDYPAKEKIPLAELLATKYQKFGYRFVPLVRSEISLLCSSDVLFLRRDIPGSIISAGDIDNRIKTLIDALRCPKSPNELTGEDQIPAADECPFFCLLEDDNQLTQFAVETDTPLDAPTNDDADQRKASALRHWARRASPGVEIKVRLSALRPPRLARRGKMRQAPRAKAPRARIGLVRERPRHQEHPTSGASDGNAREHVSAWRSAA